MAKAKQDGTSWIFTCPGCNAQHQVDCSPKRWVFSGTPDRPNLWPSIMLKPATSKVEVCHSIVKGGKIEFQPDCTHALKGKTVDLPEIE